MIVSTYILEREKGKFGIINFNSSESIICEPQTAEVILVCSSTCVCF